MELLIAAVVAFLMGAFIHRLGVQDGLNMNKGRDLQPINPVKATVDTVVQAKQTIDNQKSQTDLLKGLSNMMNYTGDEKGGD